MKKVLFVIPKVLNGGVIVRIKKGLLILASVLFLMPKLFADQHEFGCRFGNRIFQNYDISHPGPTNFQIDSDGNGNPNGYAHVDEKCTDGSTTPCTLYDFDDNIVGYGVLADFSIDYCPLDNNMLTLFIFATCIGLIRLLKPG